MLLDDLCTYVIINITVYLMLLLLIVFRIKDMLKAFKERFLSELLLLLILALIFIFTPDTYIGSKYRLSVYLICNNRYRHRPWKTHIGRPLLQHKESPKLKCFIFAQKVALHVSFADKAFPECIMTNLEALNILNVSADKVPY